MPRKRSLHRKINSGPDRPEINDLVLTHDMVGGEEIDCGVAMRGEELDRLPSGGPRHQNRPRRAHRPYNDSWLLRGAPRSAMGVPLSVAKAFHPALTMTRPGLFAETHCCSDKQRRHEWIACFGNCDLAIAGIHEEI